MDCEQKLQQLSVGVSLSDCNFGVFQNVALLQEAILSFIFCH